MNNIVIKDTRTGERFRIDRQYARVRHCQKRVFAWARAMDPVMKMVGIKYRLVMIRLSYAPGNYWRPNDIRSLMLRLKKELGSALQGYAWTAELQQRGAVHYHLILVVDRGTQIPYMDQAGWWSYGSTRSETARSVFYICSYLTKESYQKFGEFPAGLRMFAVWLRPGLVDRASVWLYKLSALPGWLSDEVMKTGKMILAMRVPGGGWLVDGLKVTSPYRVVWV